MRGSVICRVYATLDSVASWCNFMSEPHEKLTYNTAVRKILGSQEH